MVEALREKQGEFNEVADGILRKKKICSVVSGISSAASLTELALVQFQIPLLSPEGAIIAAQIGLSAVAAILMARRSNQLYGITTNFLSEIAPRRY